MANQMDCRIWVAARQVLQERWGSLITQIHVGEVRLLIRGESTLSLATLLLISGLVVYGIRSARNGRLPQIRPIPGLMAIEEAVGRATELGKPVHYNPGLGDLVSEVAPQTLAGLDILSYVARTCARYNADLIVTNRNAVVHPITEEIVRQAFLAEGVADKLKPETVRFLSEEQFAYAASAMGIIQREQAAANIMIGAYYAEALLLAESAAHVGAIQIGSTARMYQLPFFVAACDYTLLGDEMYAGGAYVSRDPVRLGSILGQDIAKIIMIALGVLGTLSATFGSSWLKDLFTIFGK